MNKRNELFEHYLSQHLSSNLDMTRKRLSREFDQFHRNLGTLLPMDKSANILEIGFGTGYLLKYLLSINFTNLHGVEICKEEVDYVKETIHSGVELVNDTPEFLHRNRDQYDLILAFDVLEHIPKDEVVNFLKAVKTSLKPGGKFIARVPNSANPFNVQNFFHDFTHEVFYNSESLEHVLSIAGFSDASARAWKEERRSLHSKITNLTSPVMYKITHLVMGLSRLYFDPKSPMTRNIYGQGTKNTDSE